MIGKASRPTSQAKENSLRLPSTQTAADGANGGTLSRREKVSMVYKPKAQRTGQTATSTGSWAWAWGRRRSLEMHEKGGRPRLVRGSDARLQYHLSLECACVCVCVSTKQLGSAGDHPVSFVVIALARLNSGTVRSADEASWNRASERVRRRPVDGSEAGGGRRMVD